MRRFSHFVVSLPIILVAGTRTYSQQLIHDTLFFQREIWRVDSTAEHPHTDIHYSGSYLEKNRSSKYYKQVLDFNFKKITVLGNCNPNARIDYKAWQEIPKEWYPVLEHNGSRYICSINWFNKSLLTDTAFLESGMEGVYSSGLNSFKKLNMNTFELSAHGRNGRVFNVKVHIIDTTMGLAVFEYFVPGEKKHDYELKVGGLDKIRSFPLIASFSQIRILPDTIWYAEKPAGFYVAPFEAKSLLPKNNFPDSGFQPG